MGQFRTRRLVGVAALVGVVALGGGVLTTTDVDLVPAAHHEPGRGLPEAPAPLEPKAAPTVAPIEVTPKFAGKIAKNTGIPPRAAQAYLAAAGRVAKERPGCKLGWNTLAGIGSVESKHGTLDGRTLAADGVSSPVIVGPALAPGSDFAALRPTPEFTRIHGNAAWDHALGPMQFIGSTWARWASDGDGDGTKNPLDIDDASVAAARYLCASGRPLQGQAWNNAILSYNYDLGYAAAVFDRAVLYAKQVD